MLIFAEKNLNLLKNKTYLKPLNDNVLSKIIYYFISDIFVDLIDYSEDMLTSFVCLNMYKCISIN